MSLRDYFSNNKIFTGTEKPTQGKFDVGDIVVNIGPNSAEEPMWICVEAGTPGVWELCSGVDGGEIGNMNELQTTDKSSIVGAINELFQSANNGKELIANAIGEPVSSEDTFQAMSNDINSLLSTFKTNMMNSGVTVNSSDKFKSLIDKIKGLTEGEGNKGIQMVSGIIENLPSGSEPFITVDLNFKAEFIIINSYTDYLGFNNPDESGYLVAYEGGAGLIRGANSIAFYPKGTTSGSAALYDFLTNALFSNCYVNDTGFRLPIYQPYNNSFSKPNNPTDVRYVAIGVGEEDTTLRDSLAFILQEEGIIITEDDDMASLISKVDEEFTKDNNTINNLTNELAGKVTPVGTAVASNVLTGKTFINSTGNIITGSMANQGAKTFTPSASNQTGAAGYYSSVTCNAVSNLTAANIRSGVTVGGVTGTCIAAPTSMLGSWYHTGFMYKTTVNSKTTTITHNKGNTNYSIVISSYGEMHSSSSSYNYLSSNSFVDGSTTTTTITFNNTTATYTITVTKNANTLDLSFRTTAGYGVDAHVFIGIL